MGRLGQGRGCLLAGRFATRRGEGPAGERNGLRTKKNENLSFGLDGGNVKYTLGAHVIWLFHLGNKTVKYTRNSFAIYCVCIVCEMAWRKLTGKKVN